MQRWMDSKPGQLFLNYAYSWGASIVILGALFKLTHIDGADIMLFVGMGTEVIVFFLAGFEKPYDDKDEETTQEETETANGGTVVVGGGIPAGGTIIIGGGNGQAANASENVNPVDPEQLAGAIASAPIMTSAQFNGMCPELCRTAHRTD